ncbi:M73 family metallopeptidase [Blastococcus atacamensis]|uniref:hypothetical protein n=1 Tax=Blastococcus atacamensis TaxID=2070508 RepID=UPI0012FFEFE5|nr:hypothetical protein [Blastococcus atacamensis]
MSTSTGIATSSTARKVVASLGILGATAAIAGLGTFGDFTSSTTPTDLTVGTGTVAISAAAQGTATLAATDFVPGDSMTRVVSLKNDGAALGALNLNTMSSTSTKLTSDALNGLQLRLESCSAPWTDAVVPVCNGTKTTVSSGQAVRTIDLASSPAMGAGKTDYLAVTLSLPTTAGNDFQNLSTKLSLVFTGTQRSGTAR